MKPSSTDGVAATGGAVGPPALPDRPAPARQKLPFGPLGPWIPSAAATLVRTIARTCRVVERRNEAWAAHRLLAEKKNVILALWHNRIFYSLAYWSLHYRTRGVRFSLLVSASKDGEILARAIEHLGGDPVRGSSSRKGREGLLGMLSALEKGHTCAVTPDGPRGPRYVAHPGITMLAQKSGVPIVPITVGIRNSFVFNSWDRFILPLPCSRVRVLYGDPIWVPENADDAIREHFRRKLEDDLNALTRDADDWRTLGRTIRH